MQIIVWLFIFCMFYSTKAYSAELNLIFAGTGGGSVNGDMSCTSGATCASKSFAAGEYVILLVSPNSSSTFSGWSGACTTVPCFFAMDGDKTVTATFSLAPKVKIGTNVFSDLQAAYDDTSTTTGAIIKLLEGEMPYTFTALKDISVTLVGGHNATYTTVNSATMIKSPMVIKAGTINIRGAIYVKPLTLAPNAVPIANAGIAQSVLIGTITTLDGSASSDADAELLTYSWSFASKPLGSSAELSSADVAKPTFTPDVAGSYVISLVVNDGKVNSIAANVKVTAVNSGGTLTTKIGTNDNSYVRGIVLQPDGKIVAAGNGRIVAGASTDFVLARYNKDGSLDTSFSGTGIVNTNIAGRIMSTEWVNGVALQTDGKIVVVGYSVTYMSDHYLLTLVRYNPDGSLDTDFNGNGKVTLDGNSRNLMGNSIAIQADGKILVAGSANCNDRYTAGYCTLLVRYNRDGSLDTSFSGTGAKIDSSTLGVMGMALQTDGKILVTGSNDYGNGLVFALARYNNDGTIDTSFSGDGIVTTEIGSDVGSSNWANSVALQPNGKILVAGVSHTNSTNNHFALVRYNQDGSLDTSFSNDGIVTTNISGSADSDYAYSIAVQPDGKILVAGESTYTRSNPEVFPGFIMGGNTDFALVRYNSDGSLDTSFSGDGKVTTDFSLLTDVGYCIALQSDGAIIVAGSSMAYSAGDALSSFALTRYTSDGSLDLTFNPK